MNSVNILNLLCVNICLCYCQATPVARAGPAMPGVESARSGHVLCGGNEILHCQGDLFLHNSMCLMWRVGSSSILGRARSFTKEPSLPLFKK